MKLAIFSPDSDLSKILSFIFDMIALSLCSFICSIPIFTFGMSECGLYYACSKVVLKKKSQSITGFFKSCKENFKQATLATLIILAGCLLIAWAMWISYQMMAQGDMIGRVLFFFELVICIFILGYISFIFPTLASYKYSLKELFSISLKLSISYLPITILFGLLYVGMAIALYYFWVFLIILPGLVGIIKALILEKIYKKHTEA